MNWFSGVLSWLGLGNAFLLWKGPGMREMHAMLYTLCAAVGASAGWLFVLVYHREFQGFDVWSFSPWSVATGLLFPLEMMLALAATEGLALGVATGLWTPITTVVASLWNGLLSEKNLSWNAQQCSSLLVIALGMGGIAWAQRLQPQPLILEEVEAADAESGSGMASKRMAADETTALKASRDADADAPLPLCARFESVCAS